jgi:hypothetical protein
LIVIPTHKSFERIHNMELRYRFVVTGLSKTAQVLVGTLQIPSGATKRV